MKNNKRRLLMMTLTKTVCFIQFLLRAVGAASAITLLAAVYFKLNLKDDVALLIIHRVFMSMLFVTVVIGGAIYSIRYMK